MITRVVALPLEWRRLRSGGRGTSLLRVRLRGQAPMGPAGWSHDRAARGLGQMPERLTVSSCRSRAPVFCTGRPWNITKSPYGCPAGSPGHTFASLRVQANRHAARQSYYRPKPTHAGSACFGVLPGFPLACLPACLHRCSSDVPVHFRAPRSGALRVPCALQGRQGRLAPAAGALGPNGVQEVRS